VPFPGETSCRSWRSSTRTTTPSPKSLGFPALEQLGPVYIVHILVKQQGDFEKAAFLIRNEVETALLGTVQGKTLDGLVQWLRRVSAECERDEGRTTRCTGSRCSCRRASTPRVQAGFASSS
jgi:hypothetical protein